MIIRGKYPDIPGFHHFRTRKSGAVRFAEFHMVVDPAMSTDKSHAIHHTIAQEIKALYSSTAEIMIHMKHVKKIVKMSARNPVSKRAQIKWLQYR